MKKLVILLVGFVFLQLIIGSKVYAGRKLFIPLKTGQTFTFAVTDSAGNTWEEKILVSGTATIMKKKYFVIDVMEVGPDGPYDDPEKFFLRSTKDRSYTYDGFGVERLRRYNAPVGTTWSYTEFDGDIKERTIESIETVTVPAGTFEGCLKIHVRCLNCDDENAHYIEWVKPGFMLVKWVDYWVDPEDNPPITYELKSWTK